MIQFGSAIDPDPPIFRLLSAVKCFPGASTGRLFERSSRRRSSSRFALSKCMRAHGVPDFPDSFRRRSFGECKPETTRW